MNHRRLYSILGQVIEQLYDCNLGCSDPLTSRELLSQIFKFEDWLAAWQRDLPNDLRLVENETITVYASQSTFSSMDSLRLKMRVILTLRQMNLRLLIHRPIIIRLLDRISSSQTDQHDASLLQQMGANSVRICMDITSQLVALVRSALIGVQGSGPLLGAWWFTLYYSKSPMWLAHGWATADTLLAFNAASTIYACFLICRPAQFLPPPPMLVGHEEILGNLRDSNDTLELLDHRNPTVDRCRHYLSILIQAVGKLGKNWLRWHE